MDKRLKSEIDNKKLRIETLRHNILQLVKEEDKDMAKDTLDKISTIIAMVATDIAIAATTEQWVKHVKQAAEEIKETAEGTANE